MTLSIRAFPTPLRADPDGSVRVGKTRVLLATVVTDFQQGSTPEEIVSHFPTLELADVYAALGYYLQHREEVDRYLDERERRGNELRKKVESDVSKKDLRRRLLSQKADNGQSSD